MTPLSAEDFIVSDVAPRMFRGMLNPAQKEDWMRALKQSYATVENSRLAIQDMVADGTPFKVSSFYKALKNHRDVQVVTQSKPTLLFNIAISKNEKRWKCGQYEPEAMDISYKVGFYSNTDRIPEEHSLQHQAAYWAQELQGVIEPVTGFELPKEVF